MKKSLLISCLLFVMMMNAAHSDVPKPKKCPTRKIIREVGFNQAIPVGDQWHVAQLENNYGLAEKWSFYFASVQGSNADEAMKNAENILKKIFIVTPPMPGDYRESWSCIYTAQINDVPYIGVATTPAEKGPFGDKMNMLQELINQN